MNDKVLLRDDVINIVKSRGPILPSHVAKAISTNIIMASAYLSELVASKIIRISNIKVGGSPLYYAPGQEAQLLRFADNLNEKERRALELLKERNVLRDNALTPLMRVALREIKDFAVPLQINHNGQIETFWKWYLTPNNELEGLIKKQLEEPILQHTEPTQQTQATPQMPEVKQEMQLKQEPKKITVDKPKQKKDAFLDELNKFFEKNKIKVIESLIIKKNSEIDIVIEIPSTVGNLVYYCKAKNKQKISDSDLSTAYVKGQMKKLPVLFLSSGELSKKAVEMLNSDLKGLSFKKI